jgi:hypothetical protein
MSEIATLTDTPDFQLPDMKRISEFAQKVEGAAAFIKAAHPAEAEMFTENHHGRRARRRADETWYTLLAHSCTDSARDIIAVIEKSPAQGAAVGAEHAAFELLCELTPAPTILVHLLRANRNKAWRELYNQLILVCSQFERAAAVVETAPEESAEVIAAPKSFESAAKDLLKQAGGAYSLTEAKNELGITRQALHKRVYSGSALGMMIDKKIRLPKLQFVGSKSDKGKVEILDGIDKVTKPFLQSKAGAWAALQFLLDVDPNLGAKPIDALKEGQVGAVVHAARSHLGLDEG